MQIMSVINIRPASKSDDLRMQVFLRILYHEAKMLACNGIFARPSRPQAHSVRTGRSPKTCARKSFCGYYTTRQKCLLAMAFLRDRQGRRRTLCAQGAAQRLAHASLSADIIPRGKNACLQWHFCETVKAAGALCAHRAQPKDLRTQVFLRILYHTFALL